MNDPKDINPHTGQPYPSEPAASPAPPSFAPGGQMPSNPPASAAPASAGVTPSGSGGAPTQQEIAIRSALETVMDPEIGLSVIDLGLIREITLSGGKTFIKMMLTTPFCPYAPQMVADVKAAAQSVVPQETEVDLLADAWSPELMPDPSLLGYSF
jgi:metal-sulfur cluster biosynthetic enzyme